MRQLLRTFGELAEVGGSFTDPLQCSTRRFTTLVDGIQRLDEFGARAALVPSQFERAAQFAQRPDRGHAQVARGPVARRSEFLPRRQTASLLQACAKHVTGKVNHLGAAKRGAQELDSGLRQLMRLVEHRHVDAGQQLCHAGVTQRHVSKKQMVVDHHQVGRHRFATRLDDMALPELRAFASQAILAR